MMAKRKAVRVERRILALDLGTSCGWATNGDENQVLWGTLALRTNARYDGGGIRFLLFEEALVELCEARWPDLIVFEEVRAHEATFPDRRTGKKRSAFLVDAAHVYGGMLATLAAFAERQEPKIPYLGVNSATIKRAATGKGNANKEAMIESATRIVRVRSVGKLAGSPISPISDDEADAIALLDFALELYANEPLPF